MSTSGRRSASPAKEVLTWRRETNVDVQPCQYVAEVDEHRWDIAPFRAGLWSLCYYGPFGDYEPNMELGAVADCKARAERHLTFLRDELQVVL